MQITSSSLPRPARLVRALVLCAVLAALLAVIPHAALAGSEDASGVKLASTFARIPPEAVQLFGPQIVPPHFYDPPGSTRASDGAQEITAGTITVLPEARQIWQFFPWNEHTGVLIYDLDSLRIIHSFVHTGAYMRGGGFSDFGGEWVNAVDPKGRLFLLDNVAGTVFEYDLHTFAETAHPLGAPRKVGPLENQNYYATGISYDAKSDSILVLFAMVGRSSSSDFSTWLGQLTLTTNQLAFRLVRSCNGPSPIDTPSSTYDFPVVPQADAVFIVCHRAGDTGTVVRLTRDSMLNDNGPEDISMGPVLLETMLADPAGNRIYLVTTSGEIWAFDTATMSFVGVIAAHRDSPDKVKAGYGIDPATGRVFFLSDDFGLGVAEGRFFPIPQAKAMPSERSAAQERIFSDARTGRVFVLRGDMGDKEINYRVYQAGTAPAPPAPPDPDRSTANVAEGPNTEVRYFASGSGYGMRVLLAKGVSTIAYAPTFGIESPTALLINKFVNSKCGYTDRELFAGRVAKAEYDAGSAAATAMPVDVDDRTKQDLRHLKRCDVTASTSSGQVFKGIFATAPLGDPGQEWKYLPATCSSSDGGTSETGANDDQGEPSLGTSSVTCPLPGGELTASATSKMSQGGVTVGEASATTDIKRTAKGVETTVESWARNIDIAGTIHINEVHSIATSVSNGRPASGPMSTYATTVKGLVIGTEAVCPGECSINSVLDALNAAAVGRAQFRSGTGLDTGLEKGSDGGALTAVQKSVQRQVSDEALVGDFTTEVPGLEMVVYNDNAEWGRARQLYQFAGVSSSATYNIVVKPKDIPFDGLPLDSAIGAVSTVATPPDVTGTVFTPQPVSHVGGDTHPSGGSVVRQVLQKLARGLRLFLSNPRQMAVLFTAWCLFALPVWLFRRRRLLTAVQS